jgi:hypothetical protein
VKIRIFGDHSTSLMFTMRPPLARFIELVSTDSSEIVTDSIETASVVETMLSLHKRYMSLCEAFSSSSSSSSSLIDVCVCVCRCSKNVQSKYTKCLISKLEPRILQRP